MRKQYELNIKKTEMNERSFSSIHFNNDRGQTQVRFWDVQLLRWVVKSNDQSFAI